MNMNIREVILSSMNSDDSYTNLNSKNIISIYYDLNESEKEKIDNIFVNLCGYSLGTLLQNDNRKLLYQDIASSEISSGNDLSL
jgi:hypothetical protein